MGDKNEIKAYRIPYDIDIWWDGGCGGSDRLPDDLGKSVLFSVSDYGTAYLCPEGPDKSWRIYVDSFGFARHFTALPGGKEDTRWHIGGWPNFTDVLSCGLGVDPSLASSLGLMGQCKSGDGRLPTMFEGLSFEVGGRTLVFEDGTFSLNGRSGECWLAEYWIDEQGIPRTERRTEKMDSEGYYCSTPVITIATAAEFRLMVEFLKRESAFVSGIQGQAIRMAIAVFERTTLMLEEMDSFEASCRNYFLRGGT